MICVSCWKLFQIQKHAKSISSCIFEFKMAPLLIIWIVRIIILENKKFLWVIYANSNTFHVESFFRFKSMQKLSKFKFKKILIHTKSKTFWPARQKCIFRTGWWLQPELKIFGHRFVSRAQATSLVPAGTTRRF